MDILLKLYHDMWLFTRTGLKNMKGCIKIDKNEEVLLRDH